jgi:hypothetical protein
LINRLLLSRVCRALTVDGNRLPSIAPRDDSDRSTAQAALQKRLDEIAHGKVADNETLATLADAIRAKPDASSVAIATQQAVGRWFVSDYVANARTWHAAQRLQAAVSSKNLIYVLYLFLFGKVRHAQNSLGRRVNNDRAGIHATGIAVHNMVRGFHVMQQVWHDKKLRQRLSDEAVLGRCLFAPENILRQATASSTSSVGDLKAGTLTVLSLEAARSRDPGTDISFMSQSWSHCPAGSAVLQLFRAVWLKLKADEQDHG